MLGFTVYYASSTRRLDTLFNKIFYMGLIPSALQKQRVVRIA